MKVATATGRNSRITVWRKTLLGELVEVAIIALVLFLVARGALQNFKVNGHSMLPNLHNNELILVDKLSYDFSSPGAGDIVVFRYPLDPSRDFIKRVIGVPGDTVKVVRGTVYVNGKAVSEPYVRARPDYRMLTIPRTKGDVVPAGDYFVLGDNRNNSDDSHLWGVVPRHNIIGRAFLAYWPVSDFGLLSRL